MEKREKLDPSCVPNIKFERKKITHTVQNSHEAASALF
jgi:hypothetical protein